MDLTGPTRIDPQGTVVRQAATRDATRRPAPGGATGTETPKARRAETAKHRTGPFRAARYGAHRGDLTDTTPKRLSLIRIGDI